MKQPDRFVPVHQEGGVATKRQIIQDRLTGVQYLYVMSGYGIAITPLLGRDGKPIIGPQIQE